VFIVAAFFIAVGAGICTRARAYGRPNTATDGERCRSLDRSRYFGELCYAIGLASLVPVAGFCIIVGGEALRILRLILRQDGGGQNSHRHPMLERSQLAPPAGERVHFRWREAVRREAVKWGILVTMIVFVITL